MTEPKSSEQYEVEEAMEMLGKGYQHKDPAVEIVPPHTVMERRERRFQEIERAAFIKISTSFKEELKNIDGSALKVWLFIALSVNRYSGKANPGLRTIAKECDLSINTVQSAIERLEKEYDLLKVDRNSRRYNIYEPEAFVSANRKEPVSKTDTVGETVSKIDTTVSVNDETVSARVIHNQINQKNQKERENTKKPDLVDAILQFEQIAQDKEAKREAYPYRDKFPEPIREWSDLYVKLTGQRPLKKDVMDWIMACQDWIDAGFVKQDIIDAYNKSKGDDKGFGAFSVTRPGSLTNTANMYAGLRRQKGTASSPQSELERGLALLRGEA